MTRFGFFLFNLLLIVFIYGLVYLYGAKQAGPYMMKNFSIPYLVLILLMTLITTIRWFMHHDPEVGAEIVTWVILLLVMPLLTIGALYLTDVITGNFWEGMHGLFTLR